MKGIQSVTPFRVGSAVLSWSMLFCSGMLLSGCNMANSDSGVSSSSSASVPSASVTLTSASTEPDEQGYYAENTTFTVNATASGSLGSTVSCAVELAYKSGASSDFNTLQTLNGCGAQTFNLYSGAGVYRFKLTATDANSLVAEDQKFVIAVPLAIGDEPYLSADFDFTVSTDPESLFDVALDATPSTKGEGGDIATYTWQVRLKEDDEDESWASTLGPYNSPTTNITVNRDGIYVVRLTLVDQSEQTAMAEKMVVVGSSQTLIADFSVSVSGAAPVNVDVDASSSIISAGVDHYVWEVYDAATTAAEDTESLPIYRLTVESATAALPIISAGTYLIRLKIIDSIGNEHEISRVVSVS